MLFRSGRAAHRTLALLPGFALAHWLIATVHVARQAYDEAERALDIGIASLASEPAGRSRFSAVALHWLRGLLYFARDERSAALASFERELALEAGGHLYARECCANTWYAIGALRWHQGDRAAAAAAFQEAVTRVSRHPLARLGLAALTAGDGAANRPVSAPSSVDGAIGQAVALVFAGRHGEAAMLVDQALTAAPAGNAAWIVPVEPLLHVSAQSALWTPVLARLRTRAA